MREVEKRELSSQVAAEFVDRLKTHTLRRGLFEREPAGVAPTHEEDAFIPADSVEGLIRNYFRLIDASGVEKERWLRALVNALNVQGDGAGLDSRRRRLAARLAVSSINTIKNYEAKGWAALHDAIVANLNRVQPEGADPDRPRPNGLVLGNRHGGVVWNPSRLFRRLECFDVDLQVFVDREWFVEKVHVKATSRREELRLGGRPAASADTGPFEVWIDDVSQSGQPWTEPARGWLDFEDRVKLRPYEFFFDVGLDGLSGDISLQLIFESPPVASFCSSGSWTDGSCITVREGVTHTYRLMSAPLYYQEFADEWEDQANDPEFLVLQSNAKVSNIQLAPLLFQSRIICNWVPAPDQPRQLEMEPGSRDPVGRGGHDDLLPGMR